MKDKWKKARRTKRKSKAKSKTKYADAHSFKLQSIDTSIVNATVGGGTTPKANGSVNIGPATLAASGQNRFWYGGSFRFDLSQTLQFNQLNTLFDRYKINKIRVRVIPQLNVADPTGAGVLPVMRAVYDFDDNSTPTVGDIWSRRGIERRLDKPFTMNLKPHMLNLIVGRDGVAANSPRPAGYLDMRYGDVPHFGIKFAVKDWLCNSTPNTMVLRFEITYFVTVKNQIQIGRAIDETEPSLPVDLGEEEEPCENQPTE